MKHRFDRIVFNKRQDAKKELQKPHTLPNSIPELRDRVDEIEKIIGVIPPTE